MQEFRGRGSGSSGGRSCSFRRPCRRRRRKFLPLLCLFLALLVRPLALLVRPLAVLVRPLALLVRPLAVLPLLDSPLDLVDEGMFVGRRDIVRQRVLHGTDSHAIRRACRLQQAPQCLRAHRVGIREGWVDLTL